MEKLSTPSINLAKNRGEKLSDRILTFALSIGRVLVIVTEAIALGAFLFRFGLDRQLVDLHDKIKQEQAIIALLKTNETTYRNLQDRLLVENTLDTASTNSVNLFKGIYTLIPSNMTLTSLLLSDTTITIQGDLTSPNSLTDFVNKLKAYASVDRVSIDKIENRTSEGIISISITAYMKKIPGKVIL